jgi:hypothetical protein
VVPVPAGGEDTQLEQIREMQAKLDEEAGQLVQLRHNIKQEWASRALAGEARHQAQDIQRHIANDARARLPRPPAGSARIWLQRQCCIERCRSRPPPRGGVSRENSRTSWRMPRSDGPRALPPEGKGAPGASRSNFPIHAGSLGPHRAHAGRDACSPRSPRQQAPSPRPLSPSRREGAPRLPPQAWGTLRQRGGSEPLARATRSTSLQPGHTTGVVPDPVPSPDYHH